MVHAKTSNVIHCHAIIAKVVRSRPETDSATAMISPAVNTVNIVHKLNSLQTVYIVHTLRSDYQGLTLTSQNTTVGTM